MQHQVIKFLPQTQTQSSKSSLTRSVENYQSSLFLKRKNDTVQNRTNIHINSSHLPSLRVAETKTHFQRLAEIFMDNFCAPPLTQHAFFSLSKIHPTSGKGQNET